MANITGKAELAETPADGDKLYLVDVSDTTDNANGSDKHVTRANLVGGLQAQPSEGAFANGDKTKLDAIEASADVTDTANVTSAGALMDSEVTNLAQVKAFDTTDYASASHNHEGTAILSTGEVGGTKFLREDGDGTSSWQAVAGGGDALTANPLSQFAATTSAQLAGVLSDETGSGAAVFATSPSLTTPALGTPSALVATNASGTAASLTAGNATQASALKSATTTVNVDSATAPSTGQVLTATGTTAATWQTPAAGGGNPFNATYTIGSTGDYATLNAYIADSPASGDILFIDGNHTLTADVTFASYTNITIIGYRTSAITLGAYDITDMGANGIIEGITFLKTGAGYVRCTSLYWTVKNVVFTVSATNNNALLSTGDFATFENITITSATSAINQVFYMGGKHSSANNIHVSIVSGASGNSIAAVKGDYCKLVNFSLKSTTHVAGSIGIELDGNYSTATGLTIESYFSKSIQLKSTVATLSNSVILNMTASTEMISVESAGNTITGCYLYGQATGITGIHLTFGQTQIVGCTIRGLASGTGITNDDGDDNNMIVGNFIWSWTTGVNIVGSAADYTMIASNKLSDNTTDISDSGTNTYYQTATDSDPLNEIH